MHTKVHIKETVSGLPQVETILLPEEVERSNIAVPKFEVLK